MKIYFYYFILNTWMGISLLTDNIKLWSVLFWTQCRTLFKWFCPEISVLKCGLFWLWKVLQKEKVTLYKIRINNKILNRNWNHHLKHEAIENIYLYSNSMSYDFFQISKYMESEVQIVVRLLNSIFTDRYLLQLTCFHWIQSIIHQNQINRK